MTSHDIFVFSAGGLITSFIILGFAAISEFVAVRREQKSAEEWAE